jgi:hypothetical protein
MAFVWSPASDDCLDVDFFCSTLFLAANETTGSKYTALNNFKTWIGAGRMDSLNKSMQDATSEHISSAGRKVVGLTLAILFEVFQRDSVPAL